MAMVARQKRHRLPLAIRTAAGIALIVVSLGTALAQDRPSDGPVAPDMATLEQTGPAYGAIAGLALEEATLDGKQDQAIVYAEADGDDVSVYLVKSVGGRFEQVAPSDELIAAVREARLIERPSRRWVSSVCLIVGTAFDVTFDYAPLDATITRDDRMRLTVVAYLGENREE